VKEGELNLIDDCRRSRMEITMELAREWNNTVDKWLLVTNYIEACGMEGQVKVSEVEQKLEELLGDEFKGY